MRTPSIKKLGVSRVSNIYAYISVDTNIIDITCGDKISFAQLYERSQQAILTLDVAAEYCYASDLDLFDQIKDAFKRNETVDTMIDRYWRTVVNVKYFRYGMIARPEAMIVCDIEPNAISIVKQ